VGIDNDMRRYFFGTEASTQPLRHQLEESVAGYRHKSFDIRDWQEIDRLFAEYGTDISLVVHAAAQPSHDWAAREPLTDFGINATATLHLLEATRRHCPQAVFVFTSTNKVYGDRPNRLPMIESTTRWSLSPSHPFANRGIDESMPIDRCMHSVFGASKAAADIMVQEYGRYFGLNTGVFRCGCISGGAHAGAELHGFLAWVMRCAVTGRRYTIFGYKGKQVRDNIHALDLVSAFDHFRNAPRPGAVYNMGGGMFSNCSVLEAIDMCEKITGTPLITEYVDSHRTGDHIWWISDTGHFKADFPDWSPSRTVEDILIEIHTQLSCQL
jgi:CDP-paratose 2-epimerase